MSSKGYENVTILARDTIMLQHVIMHFLRSIICQVVAYVRLKTKENLIFNDVTRNLRRDRSVI